MKLSRLFNEVITEGLTEGIISVPDEVLKKVGELHKGIITNWDKLINKAGDHYDNPYVAPELTGFFKLDDQGGNPISISIGLYNDAQDAGAGRMDTQNDELLINMAFFDADNPEGFKGLIEHELVHAMDPLVRDMRVFGKYYGDKGAEPSGKRINLSKKAGSTSEYERNMLRYFKSQHEYNAFMTPLITLLKKVVKGDGAKVKTIFHIFNAAKDAADSEEVYHATPDEVRAMFSDSEDEEEINMAYWTFLSQELFNFVNAIGTKPTLYKDFIKKVYVELTK